MFNKEVRRAIEYFGIVCKDNGISFEETVEELKKILTPSKDGEKMNNVDLLNKEKRVSIDKSTEYELECFEKKY